MLTKMEIEKILIDSEALLTGHFLLASGKHSAKYMQCAKILENPCYAEAMAKELAYKLKDVAADIVIGPAMGGIIIGYELARQLSVISMFAERKTGCSGNGDFGNARGGMVLRRGFNERVRGKNIIVAEDVVTTGGSVREVIAAVNDNGGIVKAVAAIIDRSNNTDFGVRYEYVYSADFDTYDPDNCPLCKEGKLKAVKPGSGGL
jgi:orotate phosphoribosyltransferase